MRRDVFAGPHNCVCKVLIGAPVADTAVAFVAYIIHFSYHPPVKIAGQPLATSNVLCRLTFYGRRMRWGSVSIRHTPSLACSWRAIGGQSAARWRESSRGPREGLTSAMKDAAKAVTHMSQSQIGIHRHCRHVMVGQPGQYGWYAAQGDWKRRRVVRRCGHPDRRRRRGRGETGQGRSS
jgi:hypothetical protein